MIVATACLMALCAQPGVSLDEFLAKFAEARKNSMAIEAEFEQKSIVPGETLATAGTLFYTRPRSILFHTADPDVSTLVDESRVYEYEPGLKQCLVYDARDAGAPEHLQTDTTSLDVFFLAFENDTAKLRQTYDLSLFSTEGEKGQYGLSIKPKPEKLDSAPFQEASLYLRDTDYLPYRIRIVTDKDSQLLIEVSKLTVQSQPQPEKIQVRLPEGTTLVVNDVRAETVGAQGRIIPLPATGASTEAVPPAVQVKELPAPSGAIKP